MFGSKARESRRIQEDIAQRNDARKARIRATKARDRAHRESLAETQATQLRYGRRNHNYGR